MFTMFFEPFRYPNDFCRRFKKAFPNDDLLHRLLDKGASFSIKLALQQAGEVELLEEWQKIWEKRPSGFILPVGM